MRMVLRPASVQISRGSEAGRRRFRHYRLPDPGSGDASARFRLRPRARATPQADDRFSISASFARGTTFDRSSGHACATASGVKEQSSDCDQRPRAKDWTTRWSPASWWRRVPRDGRAQAPIARQAQTAPPSATPNNVAADRCGFLSAHHRGSSLLPADACCRAKAGLDGRGRAGQARRGCLGVVPRVYERQDSSTTSVGCSAFGPVRSGRAALRQRRGGLLSDAPGVWPRTARA